jgi:hypothetical protein
MDDPKQTLERTLSRMEAALSGRPPQRQEGPGSVATALGVLAIALMVAGATKGLWLVFAMGVILAVNAAVRPAVLGLALHARSSCWQIRTRAAANRDQDVLATGRLAEKVASNEPLTLEVATIALAPR